MKFFIGCICVGITLLIVIILTVYLIAKRKESYKYKIMRNIGGRPNRKFLSSDEFETILDLSIPMDGASEKSDGKFSNRGKLANQLK